MRKSCVQFVYTARAFCARTHTLYAHAVPVLTYAGYYRAVTPHLLRTHGGMLSPALSSHFLSVMGRLFPTIHMTNNNYNFLYIPILVIHS